MSDAAPPPISTALVELFESGASILVGTCSAALLPESARACGAIVRPDRRTMTVFLPASAAAKCVANVAENPQIAVSFSNTLDHRTIQVKGRVLEVRDATAEERDVVVRYHGALMEVLAMVAIPREVLRRFRVWPAAAITFEVEAMFQQTPGPHAGEPVRGEVA